MNKFTIEYSEYHIAGLIQEHFPKQSNFSVSIPLTRQQKYYDLLIYSAETKKSLTIQVKSSRTYIHNIKEKKEGKYDYYAWLNNFKISEYSDYYFIFISYPIFDRKTFRPKTNYGIKILVFDKVEMEDLLSNVKTKKGTQDRFFGFGFNMEEEKVFGTRGFSHMSKMDVTKNLFENKVKSLKLQML